MPNRCGLLLLLSALLPASALPLEQLIDPARSRAAGGAVGIESGTVVIRARIEGSTGLAELVFRQPLATAGKERLVLEARAEERTATVLCVSRTELLGGQAASGYEPDLLFPPHWCLAEVLTAELPPLPAQVTGLRLNFWAPYSTGGEIRLHLRRLELQSTAEVAAELVPGPRARAARPLAPLDPSPAEQRWVSISPGGGGWFRSIAISPLDGACFVGGDVGGVYRSRDGEATWEMLNAGLANTYVNGFAFHPSDPRVVYAATNGGPAVSADGGETWRMLRGGLEPLRTFAEDHPVSALLVDRTAPQRVWAGIGHERGYGALGEATRGGRVLLSDDGGEQWRSVDLPLGTGAARASVLALLQDHQDPRLLLAVTPQGVCRSADRGQQWSRLATPAGYQWCFLALHPSQPGTWLLSYRSGPEKRGGVLRTTDGGATWEPASEGLPADETAWRIVADAHRPGRFILSYNSQAGLFETLDCGASWRPFSPGAGTRWSWGYPHAIGTGLAIDPRDSRRVLFCDDIDLLHTLDGGASWESVIAEAVTPATPEAAATWRGRGCDILCMGGPQAVAVDPAQPRTLLAGYWDLHTWRSDDGGRSLARVVSGTTLHFGRTGAILFDPANPDVIWLSVGHNYDRQRLYQSVNGGVTFRLVGHERSGLPPGGIFTLLLDPSSPPERRTLYAGVTEYGVFRSDDGGLSWSDSSRGLPADSRMIKQLALDPRQPRRLYLAAGAHYHRETRTRVKGYLAVSDDGGQQWRITRPEVEAQCLLVDPNDPQRLYAGNRNYSGVDYPAALYLSTDAGESWETVGQEVFAAGPGRPDGDQGWRTYVTALAADPTQPGLLYAGLTNESYNINHGRGVWFSRDYGRTWAPFDSTGLANLRVHTLVVDPVNPRRIYVGTGGNGLFRWGPAP